VRWARADGAALAYQVVGEGTRDIVVLVSGVSHLEVFWDLPENVENVGRLAALGRVILFDKRGVGLSDRPAGPVAPLDTSVDDVVAVLDAAGSRRAVLFAWLHEGATALAVAARHPDRVEAVVAGELLATFTPQVGHPWGWDPAWWEQMAPVIEAGWGEGVLIRVMAQNAEVDADPRLVGWWKRLERLSASPSAAARLLGATLRVDARPYLEDVVAPVLLLHDAGNRLIPEEGMRWLAERLPDARFRVVQDDRMLAYMPGDRMLDEVEDFLTGARSGGGRDRQLCVLLVSDIAGSTEQLAADGGDAWRRRLDAHRRSVREALARNQGAEIDTAGDGFLATFALPSRALACAAEMLRGARDDGIHLRVGVHVGEVTVRAGAVTGMAVHVAARVCSAAAPDSVAVTETVATSVVGVTGSPRFEELGDHDLKGVPGHWRLWRARP
jgi:class 3 adenylate cyclase